MYVDTVDVLCPELPVLIVRYNYLLQIVYGIKWDTGVESYTMTY